LSSFIWAYCDASSQHRLLSAALSLDVANGTSADSKWKELR